MHIAFKVKGGLKGLPNQAAEPRHLHSASAGWGCWMLLRQDTAGYRRMPQVSEGSVSVLQELVKDHRFSLQTRDAGAVLSGLRWISGVDQHSGSSYDIL